MQNKYVLPKMTHYSRDWGAAVFTDSTHCGELSDPKEKRNFLVSVLADISFLR